MKTNLETGPQKPKKKLAMLSGFCSLNQYSNGAVASFQLQISLIIFHSFI